MFTIINLTYTPQRSDLEVEYLVDGDVLTVVMDGVQEVFDFTGIEEGSMDEIIVESILVDPIVEAEKIGDTIELTVIRFYGIDEKHLFEEEWDGYN